MTLLCKFQEPSQAVTCRDVDNISAGNWLISQAMTFHYESKDCVTLEENPAELVFELA